ncbi:hypothetical protein A3862_27505 [Methylobacterium sp. XJLW]|nr:hypothetical protein A3862_27505 [Methylobacterium sp. XJLW]
MGDTLQINNFENYKIISGQEPNDHLFEALADADIFIYQPLGEGHGIYSTFGESDNILNRLKISAVQISMPYIYNNGLWPMYHEGSAKNTAAIDAYLSDGATAQDVIKIYDSGDMFFDMKNRMRQSLEMLRDREAGLDIKIADYIEQNMLDRELLFVQNHPTTDLFRVAIEQMIRHIFGEGFQLPRVDYAALGSNYSDLPGRYPIDRYCIEEGGIRYVDAPEEGAQLYYHGLIYMRHEELNKHNSPPVS